MEGSFPDVFGSAELVLALELLPVGVVGDEVEAELEALAKLEGSE